MLNKGDSSLREMDDEVETLVKDDRPQNQTLRVGTTGGINFDVRL